MEERWLPWSEVIKRVPQTKDQHICPGMTMPLGNSFKTVDEVVGSGIYPCKKECIFDGTQKEHFGAVICGILYMDGLFIKKEEEKESNLKEI